MSVYRVGHSQAKPGKAGELREFLLSILPTIRSSRGCESVELYQSQNDPGLFTIVEAWEDVDSHRASLKEIPAEKLAGIRPLLASAPQGGYFELVDRR